MAVLLCHVQEATLWTLFGRFHPAIVHFPVALLTAAALFEIWHLLRKRPGISSATLPCMVLGAATAVFATLMGWSNASGRTSDEVLEAHRWAGVATTCIAILATLLYVKATQSHGIYLQTARVMLLIGVVLVGLTGHWGGSLVFGDEYYKSGAPTWIRRLVWPENQSAPLHFPANTSKINFITDVAPILESSCLKCHLQGKAKGKLRLDTRELAMKGGENGPVIVPGKPGDSTLYTLLLDADVERRMPAKAKALPTEQIEMIRRWIENGADWPNGITLKLPDGK